MLLRRVLLSAAFLLALAACGGRDDASTPTPDVGGDASTDVDGAACVDFVQNAGDLGCLAPSDCTYIGKLDLCPGDVSCGDENPVNQAAAARYAKATAGVPLASAECGAPAPVTCVAGRCVIEE